jgi:hypothetical protein
MSQTHSSVAHGCLRPKLRDIHPPSAALPPRINLDPLSGSSGASVTR